MLDSGLFLRLYARTHAALYLICDALQVSGPERDLHSGNDGGVFHEPMADLVQLLGSLHGPGGKISVPGFANNVRPQLMDLAWQGLEHSEEFSMKSYRCGGQGLGCGLRGGVSGG
jgi:di- and tripeptidase/Cys-Gly metallodipeptidase DUG1